MKPQPRYEVDSLPTNDVNATPTISPLSDTMFERYPITGTMYTGTIAAPKFSTNNGSSTFTTRINEDVSKFGVNFAGHYTFVIIGCGSSCANSYIVDDVTGSIYTGPQAGYGFEFKSTSTLIIVGTNTGVDMYFEFKNNVLKQIKTVPTQTASFTPSPKPSSFQSFIDVAKSAECADQRNDLYLIDNSLVFWAKQGRCADGGYGYVLYGKTPSDRLCYIGDSIAGPQTSCTTEQYRSLFNLIQQHLSDPQLNLPGHTTQLIYRGVSL